MEFFASAVDTLKVLVMAIGCGLGAWGIVNLLEGYGADNPASKSQGMKQLMAGGGIVLLGMNLIPLLANLFYSSQRSKLCKVSSTLSRNGSKGCWSRVSWGTSAAFLPM